MSFKKVLTLGVLALSQLTQAIPQPAPDCGLEARELYSLDFGHTEDLWKRKLYNVDDIPEKTQRKALRQGLRHAVAVAKTVLDKMDSDEYKDMLGEWFGDDENYPPMVRQVFQNFVGEGEDGKKEDGKKEDGKKSDGNKEGGEEDDCEGGDGEDGEDGQGPEGTEVLGKVTVYQEDYLERKSIKFCDVNLDGKRGTAYFKRKDGKPAMHFCPKFLERKNAKDYISQACGANPKRITTDSIGRAFQGANVLHEFMHYSEVGKEATGTQITDMKDSEDKMIGYGAYNCYTLKGKELPNGFRTIDNADSYVYYAMHIWLTETCKEKFDYPRDEKDN